MARFIGLVGVKQPAVEVRPGIFEEVIIETKVSGEIQNNRVRWSGEELQQEKVKANHVVSIIVSEEQMEDFSGAVYVTWQSRKWVVSNIQYNRPRIKLTLGSHYNE